MRRVLVPVPCRKLAPGHSHSVGVATRAVQPSAGRPALRHEGAEPWGAAERRPSRHAWPVSSSTAHPTPTSRPSSASSLVSRRRSLPAGRRTTTRTSRTPVAGHRTTRTTTGPPVADLLGQPAQHSSHRHRCSFGSGGVVLRPGPLQGPAATVTAPSGGSPRARYDVLERPRFGGAHREPPSGGGPSSAVGADQPGGRLAV